MVLPAGGVLRPQEIGVAASLGLAQLLVRRKPRVAILSTGDEVAEPGSVRKPGQIYDSNRFSLRGLVEGAGAIAVDDGIVPDQFDELHARLLRAAEHADVVLTSGGVSVGDYDLVKAVLQQAGGIDFWQVAMQPGRPLAVGSIGRAHFFGLPGNPVASMLTFHLFVRPALWKLAGRRELFVQPFRATAVEPMRKKAGRREFKRGILTYAQRPLGGAHHGPPGLGHPQLDDRRQLLHRHRGGAGRRRRRRAGLGRALPAPLSPIPSMPASISTDLIQHVAPMVRDLVTSRARSRAHLRYADIRLEAIQGKYAAAENGDAKGAGEDATLGFGVRVLAGDGMAAPGYFGRGLGEADIPHLERILRRGARRRLPPGHGQCRVEGRRRAASSARSASPSPTRACTRCACARTWCRPSTRRIRGAWTWARWSASPGTSRARSRPRMRRSATTTSRP